MTITIDEFGMKTQITNHGTFSEHHNHLDWYKDELKLKGSQVSTITGNCLFPPLKTFMNDTEKHIPIEELMLTHGEKHYLYYECPPKKITPKSPPKSKTVQKPPHQYNFSYNKLPACMYELVKKIIYDGWFIKDGDIMYDNIEDTYEGMKKALNTWLRHKIHCGELCYSIIPYMDGKEVLNYKNKEDSVPIDLNKYLNYDLKKTPIKFTDIDYENIVDRIGDVESLGRYFKRIINRIIKEKLETDKSVLEYFQRSCVKRKLDEAENVVNKELKSDKYDDPDSQMES